MNVSLLLTSFNRPDYLDQCLQSVAKADLSKISTVLIVDDASTDPATKELIESFSVEGPEVIKAYSETNRGIKGSLLYGYSLLFNSSDIVINLDADALVSSTAFNRIIEMKEKYPALIVSGFHCNTLNNDGSVRHKVLYKSDTESFRKTVGGINLCINKENYYKWVKPALLEPVGNWDEKACLNSAAESLPIAVTIPSCIQHIGFISAMGHAQSEKPDTADDFIQYDVDTWYNEELLRLYKPHTDELKLFEDFIYKLEPEESTQTYESGLILPHKYNINSKLKLPQVTLIGVDCIDIKRLIKVADDACREISFSSVKLLSSIPSDDPRVIPIRHISSKEDYSQFMIKELINYIDDDYLLIIQHDGMVKNPSAWRNEWFQYDYIGAPWKFGNMRYPVGNGGFSFRSRRLHEIIATDDLIFPMNEAGVNFHKEEDHVICRIFGEYLKNKHGIKFAPVEEAEKFSIEAWDNPDPVYRGQFGVHGGGIVYQ